MHKSLIALAIAACAAGGAFAQQADYCTRSGYTEGVASDRDYDHKPCDPNAVPRVNGVPQGTPSATARPGYNDRGSYYGQSQYVQPNDRRYQDRRYYDQRDQRYYDQREYERRMGNRDDWQRYREGRYYYGARGPEWRQGAYIPREYMARQYWVNDWRAHRLYAPPSGYRWVQVGNDYVLVAIATGIIAQLMLAQ